MVRSVNILTSTSQYQHWMRGGLTQGQGCVSGIRGSPEHLHLDEQWGHISTLIEAVVVERLFCPYCHQMWMFSDADINCLLWCDAQCAAEEWATGNRFLQKPQRQTILSVCLVHHPGFSSGSMLYDSFWLVSCQCSGRYISVKLKRAVMRLLNPSLAELPQMWLELRVPVLCEKLHINSIKQGWKMEAISRMFLQTGRLRHTSSAATVGWLLGKLLRFPAPRLWGGHCSLRSSEG